MKEASPLRLICLPFAGGSARSYDSFRPYLAEHIRLEPLEIPGRGKRFRDPLLKDIDLLADDAIGQMDWQDPLPYAFFGHSLGGYLSFVMTRKIREKGLSMPIRLIASAAAAPSRYQMKTKLYELPDAAFREALKAMGGSPADVLADERMMRFFEPIIRADLEAVDQLRYKRAAPFDLPVTVMYGTGDDILPESLERWQDESTQPLGQFAFEGGHFYLFDKVKDVCATISAVLT